ncbi:MAG: DoxX family protein [Flavobacteriales bacterium]|nr:DoxX family protein [Flavobacteriales bacterium]
MEDPNISTSNGKVSLTVWVAQIILVIAFGIMGVMKLTLSIPELERILTWPGSMPEWFVRMLGALELAGALGLVLPALTGMYPWLMRWAAFGLAVTMGCALGYHLMLFQGMMMIPTLVLGVLATYVGVRRM